MTRVSAYIGSNCTGISVAIRELTCTEGLLFDKEVVAEPDIYNNFGHARVPACGCGHGT